MRALIKQPLDLEARRTGLGGTDMAAILSAKGAFSTPYEVYQDKVHGIRADLSENERVYWGNALEDVIANRYSDLMGKELICTSMCKHPELSFLIANPDRLILGESRGLEIKTAGEGLKHLWGEEGSTQIPENYFVQINHYMLVLNYTGWDVAVLFGGQELRIYSFERDPEIDGIIIEQGSIFWHEHVLKKNPPPIDYSNPRMQELIRRKYSLISEVEIDLPADYVEVTNKLEDAKEHIRQYEKLRKESEAMLLDAIGEAGKARLPDGRVFLRKTVERKAYQVEASKYVTLNLKKGA